MPDNRREQRKNAKAFIGVHDKSNGTLVGYLLDLTTGGMKLKSLKTIEVGAEYEFRMDLPVEIAESKTIVLRARSKWCGKCENSRYYETGFEIVDCPPDEADKINILLAGDLFAAEAEKLHISLSLIKQ